MTVSPQQAGYPPAGKFTRPGGPTAAKKSEKGSSKKRNVVILIAIVLALLIGGGAFFHFSKKERANTRKFDIESAYMNAALAEEAFYALNNRYSDNYDDLRTQAGLIVQEDVIYEPVKLYTQKVTGIHCFSFILRYKNDNSIGVSYDSCAEIKASPLPVDESGSVSVAAEGGTQSADTSPADGAGTVADAPAAASVEENPVSNAYYAINSAEELFFAINKSYTNDIKQLNTISPMNINDDVSVEELNTYSDSSGSKCYSYVVFDKKDPETGYFFDSCAADSLKTGQDVVDTKEDMNEETHAAIRSVVSAEHLYHSKNDYYTDNINDLVSGANLVVNPDIFYDKFTLYYDRNSGNDCVSFSVKHKNNANIGYKYDSCGTP
jgi:hypothetical protein